MKIGVSTACYYPQRTQEALEKLVSAGVEDIEVFFNTDSLKSLETIARTVEGKSRICAVHPFHCAYDWFYLYTNYVDRVEDGILMYRKLFEAVHFLQVPIVTIHGEHKNSLLSRNKSIDVLKRLVDLAAGYGITLCQENVARNRVRTAEDILELRRLLDDNIAFTIDTKQARRSGQSPCDLIEAAGRCLKHIHISSSSEQNDCIVPSIGQEETLELLNRLRQKDYIGHVIIELYRDGFDRTQQLVDAYKELKMQVLNIL